MKWSPLVLCALALPACGGAPEISPPAAVDDAGSPVATVAPPSAPPAPSPPPAVPVPTPVAPALGAPYPIVLMHGMAGFDELSVGPIGLEYWGGVRDELVKAGHDVYVTEVSPYQTSDVRAREASVQIDAILARTGKAKVVIVAHSQGGLDARVLASPNGLRYGDRIASITTVSTPHRGSYVADIILKPAGVSRQVFDDASGAMLKLLQKTAYDLESDPNLRAQLSQGTEKNMREVFNVKYVNDPRVTYESYAGRTNLRTGIGVCDGAALPNEAAKVDIAQPFLLPTAIILENGFPIEVNDGMVTVASAKWGTFVQCIPADHLKEVGQPNANGQNLQTFEHKKFYRKLVERIRSQGF